MAGLRMARLDSGLFPVRERERELAAAAGITEIIEIESYDPDEIAAADPDVIAIICGYLPASTIERLTHCRIIYRLGIGYEKIDTKAAAAKGILVCNTTGYCAHEVAEHAMALMFACARHIPEASASMKDGTWTPVTKGLKIRRIYGKTAGIVGIGRIGSDIAEYLSGFHMRVLTYDPVVDAETAKKRGAEKVDLETLLKESDYVFMACPVTPETTGMIGAEQFAMMKPEAIFINTARGQLMDEHALVAALQNHTIAYAGIDVFSHINIWGEVPNPPDGYYHGVDNVLLTPHIAYISEESDYELYETAYAQLKKFLVDNEWPDMCVNPEVREVLGK